MEQFFKFASENPALTFFLFVIIGGTIVGAFEAIAYMIRGK